MRWLTNYHDPRRPDAPAYLPLQIGETREEAVRREMAYLAGKVIGPPQASQWLTVEQLEAMGVVGIYAPEEEAPTHAL